MQALEDTTNILEYNLIPTLHPKPHQARFLSLHKKAMYFSNTK